jgi:purine-nucleoside phosphorylase
MHYRYSPDQVEAYFYGSPKSVGERILFIKRQRRLAEYRAHLGDVYTFGNVWHGVTGSFRGQQISIVVAGVGPSLVGDAVYALNRPAATYLYSGTCGGLAEGLGIGDYVLADRAVCGDGYSLHLGHPPLSVVSGDPEALQALKRQLVFRVQRAEGALTFTTSSVVREVDPGFWNSVDERCRAIEMGAAAFYAAARATGKRAAAYFWVTDLPLGGKSLLEPATAEDSQAKQDRYERSVLLDLELLAHL